MMEGKEFCIEANGRRTTDFFKDYNSAYEYFTDLWVKLDRSEKYNMINSQFAFVAIEKDNPLNVTLWSLRSC